MVKMSGAGPMAEGVWLDVFSWGGVEKSKWQKMGASQTVYPGDMS